LKHGDELGDFQPKFALAADINFAKIIYYSLLGLQDLCSITVTGNVLILIRRAKAMKTIDQLLTYHLV